MQIWKFPGIRGHKPKKLLHNQILFVKTLLEKDCTLNELRKKDVMSLQYVFVKQPCQNMLKASILQSSV